VLPHADAFPTGDDHTDEERKLNETCKILGDESIRVNATCVRVAVMSSHSESVTVPRAPLSAQRARAAVGGAGLVVLDARRTRSTRSPPTPAAATRVFIGRLRRDP
jgi:aspartate-semialdehyde dehydrogenase